MRLVELSQPGCHCGHCRHLADRPPAREGGYIFTVVITGHERHERRFWTTDERVAEHTDSAFSIGFATVPAYRPRRPPCGL